MPRIIKTARGESVDLDEILIKQQLAEAPMNIEIQRRKDFIDMKETPARHRTKTVQTIESESFENSNDSDEFIANLVPLEQEQEQK